MDGRINEYLLMASNFPIAIKKERTNIPQATINTLINSMHGIAFFSTATSQNPRPTSTFAPSAASCLSAVATEPPLGRWEFKYLVECNLNPLSSQTWSEAIDSLSLCSDVTVGVAEHNTLTIFHSAMSTFVLVLNVFFFNERLGMKWKEFRHYLTFFCVCSCQKEVN